MKTKDKPSPKNRIVLAHKKTFNTLTQAFSNGHACLLECTLKSTGEKVATICAVNVDKDENYLFTPFAMMFNGNPYELLEPPTP